MSERSDCFVSQGQGFGSRKRGKLLLTKIYRALVARVREVYVNQETEGFGSQEREGLVDQKK